MSHPKWAPVPWRVDPQHSQVWTDSVSILDADGGHVAHTTRGYESDEHDDGCPSWRNARLIAAAPDLAEAAELLEAAELAHANCPECEGLGVPELCPACFPAFDAARIKRRAALARARGETP